VHFGGQAVDLDQILPLCKKHNIRVLEDAAHAFPAKRNGKWVGSQGDVSCFSFYANKTITTGEGGMLVTNDEQLYKRAKVMRLHGINRDVGIALLRKPRLGSMMWLKRDINTTCLISMQP
jgi:dTDP-4-amino-4,6-dideoxygalactose transaminase